MYMKHDRFVIVFRQILLKRKIVSETVCTENQNKHFMYKFSFFLNRAFDEIVWENVVGPDRQQMETWRILIERWVPKATDTHSRCMQCLLLFLCSNCCTNSTHCYAICTLLVLLKIRNDITQ